MGEQAKPTSKRTLRTKPPFVRAALLCNQVIVGADKVNTIVRIVDQFSIQPVIVDQSVGFELSEESRLLLQTTLYLSLTDLPEDQPNDISFALRRDGTRKRVEVGGGSLVPGEEIGAANVTVNLNLILKRGGLYRIDVVWNDRVLTRIPFTVIVEPTEYQAQETDSLSQR